MKTKFTREEYENTDWLIRCKDCACMVPQLLDPFDFGCQCEELGIDIGAHECFGPCSYFIGAKKGDLVSAGAEIGYN